MVFTLGILWPGLTSTGALSGLVVGFIMGMTKFIMGNVFPAPSCGSTDDRPGFAKMHFMYYGETLFKFQSNQSRDLRNICLTMCLGKIAKKTLTLENSLNATPSSWYGISLTEK